MVILGLVLLVGAGVFAASAISSNTGAVGGDLWGLHISNVSVGEVFVAGLATGAVALLGLVMMFAGSRRSQRLRRERKELARENARLSQHVESAEPRADSNVWPARHAAAEPDGVPVDRNGVPVDRNGVPVDRNGVPVDRNGVPVDRNGVPVDRNGVLVDERTDQLRYDRKQGYQGPPPPSYDRANIESDRRRVDDGGYEPAASSEPVAGEAPRRRS